MRNLKGGTVPSSSIKMKLSIFKKYARGELMSRPIIGPEWFFGAAALAVGLFMALVTPPFQSPDEFCHFYRAFQLSEGRIIAERQGNEVGGNIPASVVKAFEPFEPMRFEPMIKVDTSVVAQLLQEPFEHEPLLWQDFRNTAIYTPVAYAPAITGIWAANLSGSSALKMMYAARIATLLFWVGLVFAAIRLTPVFKWVAVLIGLLPMHIFVASSLSADVMTNGLTMLLIALILRSAFAEKGTFNRREGAWLLIVSVLVVLSKHVYFLLAALAIMIPTGRFGSMKRKALYLSLLGAVDIAVNIIWAWLIQGVVVPVVWADPGKQVEFIIAYPWEYVKVLATTLSMWWWIYAQWFVGVLGWLDTWLPSWVYPSYIAVMLCIALMDKGSGRPMRLAERLFVAGTCTALLVLVLTSQYIMYTSPMDPSIIGVQGRYFIPLAMAALLVLYNRKIKAKEVMIGIAVPIFCSIVLAVTCYSLIARYYP